MGSEESHVNMYSEYQQVVTSVITGWGVSKHNWQCLYSDIKADGKQRLCEQTSVRRPRGLKTWQQNRWM